MVILFIVYNRNTRGDNPIFVTSHLKLKDSFYIYKIKHTIFYTVRSVLTRTVM